MTYWIVDSGVNAQNEGRTSLGALSLLSGGVRGETASYDVIIIILQSAVNLILWVELKMYGWNSH
jgi:hypothetical protein